MVYYDSLNDGTIIIRDSREYLRAQEMLMAETLSSIKTSDSAWKSFFNGDASALINTFVPKIENIEVMNDPAEVESQYNENGKYKKPTVIVTFSDGTTEKATTSEDDTFSLEQGISICYTKKLLSMLTTDSGSKVYNKMIHTAMKLYKSKQEEAANKEKEEQFAKERAEKLAAKRAKRKAKLEAKKREQEISIQAEAYARALRMVNQGENK